MMSATNEVQYDKIKNQDIDILLITANDIETDNVLKLLDPLPSETRLLKTYVEDQSYVLGVFSLYKTAHVKCKEMGSMGKGASFATAHDGIKNWKPKAVIMVGICFGRDMTKQSIGDILVCEKLCFYDKKRVGQYEIINRAPAPQPNSLLFDRFSAQTLWYSELQERQVKVQKTPLLSGEKIVDNTALKRELFHEHPEANGGEMEGFGLYSACEKNGVPWILIKSICDWGEGKSDDGQSIAAYNSTKYIHEILSSKVAFIDLGLEPIKLDIIKDDDIDESFSKTKNSEIVKLCHPNSQQLTQKKVTIKAKGISYEFITIEVVSGVKIGYLFLTKTCRIGNTLDSFFQNYNSDIISITICIPKSYDRDTGKPVDRLSGLREKCATLGINKIIKNVEYTYIENLLWNYCLVQTSLVEVEDIPVEDFFIDQDIFKEHSDSLIAAGQSLDYFNDIFSREQEYPINVIFGKGGVGKTTFCEMLVNRINRSNDKRAVYISATDLRGHEVDFQIGSVFDLYKLYTNINNLEKSDILGKTSFEINVSCGNIVLVIDGLDEIESMLRDRFTLSSFIESATELNQTYGNCSIVVTSRDYHADKFKEHPTLSISYLQGFNDELIEKYVVTRKVPEHLQKIALKYVKEFNIKDGGRLAPLYLSLICDIVERGNDKEFDGSVLKNTKYFVSCKPLDQLLFMLINREISKQSLGINADELFEMLAEIAVSYKGRIGKAELDIYIEVVFPNTIANADNSSKYNQYYINPLLYRDTVSPIFSIRYDHIQTWVKSRYLAKRISIGKFNDHITELFAEFYDGTNPLLQMVSDAIDISDTTIATNLEILLNNILKQYKTYKKKGVFVDTSSIYCKSISGLLYLLFENRAELPKEDKTLVIKEYYGSERIRDLFIYGSFYPLDFSNIKINHSLFDGYSNFEKCKFPIMGTVFFSSIFKNIDIQMSIFANKNLFHKSCSLNEKLQVAFEAGVHDGQELYGRIQSDLTKIFRVGYRAGAFVWKSDLIYRKKCTSLRANTSLVNYLEVLTSKGIFREEPNKFSKGTGYILVEKYYLDAKQLIEHQIIKPSINSLIKDIYRNIYTG